MAETSRSRVTITLGRSGQVVKRAGPVFDGGFSDSHSAAGSKRTIRDRLGSDVDRTQLNSKRQRGDGNKQSVNAANVVDDMRLRKDDLRFKLMRKNVVRKQHGVDLRETLSSSTRVSKACVDTWQHIPEPKDSRKHMPELKDASLLGRTHSTRRSDPFYPMDSSTNPYSPWRLDRLRGRSPDRGLGTSRGFSPQRNAEELQKRPLIRTYDEVRNLPYMSKDFPESSSSRPLGSAAFISRPTIPAGSMKPVASLPPLPSPANGFIQKSPYKVDEHLSVDSFLRSLGLEKYAISFKVEEVDMTALRQMGDNDLKELGIPMGPRKKILLALLSRSKRQF